MSLQLVTAIAQLASAAAIVPSLVFVGLQINHASKAVKASASHAHAATYHAVSAAIVDNHDRFAEIWRKGLRATDTLTEGERVRFFAFDSMLRFFDAARIQRLRDQLDQEHWQAIERQAKDLAAEPGVRAFWEARRHWHCTHFQRWFESLFVEAADSTRAFSKTMAFRWVCRKNKDAPKRPWFLGGAKHGIQRCNPFVHIGWPDDHVRGVLGALVGPSDRPLERRCHCLTDTLQKRS